MVPCPIRHVHVQRATTVTEDPPGAQAEPSPGREPIMLGGGMLTCLRRSGQPYLVVEPTPPAPQLVLIPWEQSLSGFVCGHSVVHLGMVLQMKMLLLG